jgi:hypothetical protein
MTLGQNPFNPSRTLPTLPAIQHRRRELLAYRAHQEAALPLATPNGLHTEEQTPVPEEFHFTQEQEEQQEEPSMVLPPRSSAPPPPALAGEAFHAIAGLLVRTLGPHTEADPAAILPQFLAAFGNLVGPPSHCPTAGRGRSASLWTKAQEPETALNTPKPTLMAHKALKAHTSTQRAHRALKAHTSTQRAHRVTHKWILLLLQSVCHNMCVFVAVIERTYPEGWHA